MEEMCVAVDAGARPSLFSFISRRVQVCIYYCNVLVVVHCSFFFAYVEMETYVSIFNLFAFRVLRRLKCWS